MSAVRCIFGFMRIENGDPKRLRVIEVLRDGRVVRRLSLRALEKLAVDPDGYRLLRL